MYKHKIKTAADVKMFFYFLIEYERLNFHPDTDFRDYIDLESDDPLFNSDEIEHYNSLLDSCFSICEEERIDIYNLSIQVLNPSIAE